MLADGQALVRLQELQRDADANRNIYEQFLSRFKATNEQRLLQNSQTKIASPAIPPLRPARPPLSLLLAALAIASMLVATALAALTRGGSGNTNAVVVPASADLPTPPVWARIPHMPPLTTSIWQKPIGPAAEPDVGAHLGPLLERIRQLPGDHGKVALVVSMEEGSGAAAVARSLNRAALDNAMLSVLIEVQPDIPRAAPASAAQGVSMTTANLQSVDALLAASNKTAPLPADDIRSEFDLIIVQAPPLSAQAGAAGLAAHADLVVLVVGEAADAAALDAATAALSQVPEVPIGLVVNPAAARSGVSDRRRVARAAAS
jgi:hypothetical protein